MGSLFLRNSLPVQSFISFSSATFSIKQTLRAAPAGWKCPPLTCTALAQCSGQVWNYALANKWHPTHLVYCVWYRVIWYRNLALPIVYVPYYITFWMKVFTSLRWILVAECPVLVSETTWGVCSTQPFVWWFGDWTRLGLAKWWLDKRLNIYMYAHIRHTISAHGDTGNSTTCSTVCSDQH